MNAPYIFSVSSINSEIIQNRQVPDDQNSFIQITRIGKKVIFANVYESFNECELRSFSFGYNIENEITLIQNEYTTEHWFDPIPKEQISQLLSVPLLIIIGIHQ